ncbi:hypothetical protein SAMN05421761_103217 [Belliella pelovolcani]|uniref:Uncharacterized protein n=1 Tax=Belliella pelovolcani TaxID=529505 RepID=A0A1N7LCA0_9BACT|nr:hypothetical protein SAMN05421761_103217 [Belliella pelovolcani]
MGIFNKKDSRPNGLESDNFTTRLNYPLLFIDT